METDKGETKDATQSTSNEDVTPGKSNRKSGTGGRIDGNDSNGRNKRLLANLQATLGGGGGRQPEQNGSSPRMNRTQRSRRGESSAADTIGTLEQALQRIRVSDQDICASLVDVKPFLRQNAERFTVSEFTDISSALCNAAIAHTNIYFVVEICINLIEFEEFQLCMSDCLKDIITKYLNDREDEFRNVPDFLAQLIVAKWPRKYSRTVEESNHILFTTFNTVAGWAKFLHNKCTEEGEEMDEETEFIFNQCAQGIVSFCNAGQRFIWLNFPDLFDEIFTVVVELLVGNVKLSRGTKSALLQLYLSMNKWSVANTPKFSNAATQTLR